MTAFEVFSPKDIRTCARLVRLLLSKGGTVEDLYAAANVPHLKPFKFDIPPYLAKGLFKVPIQKESILNSIGWVILRNWLRIHKILEEGEIVPKTVQNFVRKERRKWLENDPDGKIKP